MAETVVQCAASAAPWVSAAGTWTLGLIAAGFTAWQLWLNGFRPKCRAEVDPNGEAIRVRIVNRARALGVITDVRIMDSNGLAVGWAAAPEFRLPPMRLGALDQMELIIAAPNGSQFDPMHHRVLVRWGQRERTIKLTPVDVGLYGLRSILPPDARVP